MHEFFEQFIKPEAAIGCGLYKKVFLTISQNSQDNTCARRACNFVKKETLAKVFSCEICKFFKNTFFTEQLRALASAKSHEYIQKKSKLS